MIMNWDLPDKKLKSKNIHKTVHILEKKVKLCSTYRKYLKDI